MNDDHVKDQLCARIEELEAEKLELNEQLDVAQREAAEARRQKSLLAETFATEIQKAVKRARRDWASQTSDEIKALWQAEAFRELYNQWRGAGTMRVGALLDKAIELQEEAEGGET